MSTTYSRRAFFSAFTALTALAGGSPCFAQNTQPNNGPNLVQPVPTPSSPAQPEAPTTDQKSKFTCDSFSAFLNTYYPQMPPYLLTPGFRAKKGNNSNPEFFEIFVAPGRSSYLLQNPQPVFSLVMPIKCWGKPFDFRNVIAVGNQDSFTLHPNLPGDLDALRDDIQTLRGVGEDIDAHFKAYHRPKLSPPQPRKALPQVII